nr:hypothetical protein [Micromonospora sp. WMMB235]
MNLANGLARSGRLDEALAVGEETLELQREVATVEPACNPVATRGDAAAAGGVAGRRRRTVEALALGEEAIAVAREAVAGNRAANLKICRMRWRIRRHGSRNCPVADRGRRDGPGARQASARRRRAVRR